MPDNAERAQKYRELIELDGWKEFVTATKEEMNRLTRNVMDFMDTRAPGWEDGTAKAINRYQALKQNIESVARAIEKKADTGK